MELTSLTHLADYTQAEAAKDLCPACALAQAHLDHLASRDFAAVEANAKVTS